MGDPATAAAMGQVAQTVIGEKRLGDQAPPQAQQAQPALPLTGGGSGFGGLLNTPPPAPVQEAVSSIGSPPPPSAQVGPPVSRAGPAEEEQGFGGAFLGSLNDSFSSPAKLIGAGLLNQQKSGAGTAGLGLLGLYEAFNRNK